MYPFNTDETMVHNRWYLAGFSDEITREPMERTILGQPVVFYRTEAGAAVAMYGICPHRYFPLAQGGTLKGDAIACGYHGITFDADGNCIDVPSQDNALNFCQPTYTIEERGKLCWIWMGDADPDLELLPSHEDFGQDQDGWHDGSYNYFHVEGRAQLLIDNLLDLTHLPYIHSHIPGGEHLAKTDMRVDDSGEISLIIRDSKVPFTPFQALIYGPELEHPGLATIENVTAVYGPELIRTGLGEYIDINGDPNVPEGLGRFYIMHAITPETATTTHYFGWAVRDFRVGDTTLDQIWLDSDNVVRGQDAVAIKAVESRLDESARAQKELKVRSDAAAIKVRRNIQVMIDDEAAAAE
jgi:vanillate O-demethylase monooxygenase subunit